MMMIPHQRDPDQDTTRTDRTWLELTHRQLRRANLAAQRASHRYNSRLDYLMAYCKANGYTESQTRDKVATDWDLSDAAQSQTFQANEVQRLSAVLVGEFAARKLGAML